MTRHRLAFAAAHVAMLDSYAACDHAPDRRANPASIAPHIDWTTTMALRRRLDALGFGVAEAMDTAQRFDLGWDIARRLIESTGRLGLGHGFVAGAGTDHARDVTVADLPRVVAEQVEAIRAAGGVAVVLPMPQLARERCRADVYVRTYGAIAEATGGPLLVHWLGPMFLPELDGYFPGTSFEDVMALDAHTFRGAKLSMLDAALEVRLRRALLERDQIMLTGDDWNFAELIVGTGAPTGTTTVGAWTVATGDFSHALLGILDGIAEPAHAALDALERGDRGRALDILRTGEAVGRVVFEPPTAHYKAGLAHLAWRAGAQPNAMLPNRLDRARDARHYERVDEAMRVAQAAAGA